MHRLLSHSNGTNLHHSAYISIGKADVLYGYADKGCQEAAGRLASELDKLEQATRSPRAVARMRRAAVYLRVSTKGQQDTGYGLESQRQRCKDYANENELEVVTTVTEAKSAGVKDGEVLSWESRPVLLDMMERAENGSYDVLLVSSIDRLSRDLASAIVLERMLEKHGVTIVSVETGENGGPKTPEAELFATLRSAISQYERATIKLRLAGGRAIGRKKGRLVSGVPPFGYITKDGTLVPNQDADTVKQMYVDFVDGRSPGRIARELNAVGSGPRILNSIACPPRGQTVPQNAPKSRFIRRFAPALHALYGPLCSPFARPFDRGLKTDRKGRFAETRRPKWHARPKGHRTRAGF